MDERRYAHRQHLLQEAEKIIMTERNKSYGEPDEDFQRIAAIASAMGFRALKTIERPDGNTSEFVPLTGSDVARFMIALKLSRLSWMPTHRDSWLDIAGYAGCGFETATLEDERAKAAADSEATLFNLGLGGPTPFDVKVWADRAVGGDPADLEGSGYILADAPGTKSQTCGVECDEGHTYSIGCRYRIKKRRNG
jgi:hypothetical protein